MKPVFFRESAIKNIIAVNSTGRWSQSSLIIWTCSSIVYKGCLSVCCRHLDLSRLNDGRYVALGFCVTKPIKVTNFLSTSDGISQWVLPSTLGHDFFFHFSANFHMCFGRSDVLRFLDVSLDEVSPRMGMGIPEWVLPPQIGTWKVFFSLLG